MLETVVGQTLSGVFRWAWHQPNEPVDLTCGPVHLTFSDRRGLSVDARSDLTLRWLETPDPAGLEQQYHYIVPDGGQWKSRDASSEVPFLSVVGTPLVDSAPIFNAVHEVVGLVLTFDTGIITLRCDNDRGEVIATEQ